MTRRCKFGAVMAGLVALILGLAPVLFADETVTGLVMESGFSGVVVRAEGGTAIKYYTGRETVYTPEDYRPLKGDTVTIASYAKASRSGEEIRAVSALTLVKKDLNRKELSSPASGVIREVGRKGIRIDFPEVGQAVAMEMKRGMEKVPSGWEPAVGDKVTVQYERVKARFGNSFVMVIDKLQKVD